jgi:rifampicin phosphotransferase
MSDDRNAVILRDLRELSAIDLRAGGKALGLARLARLLPVPRGFVVIGAVSGDDLPDAVIEAYHALGGSVAVRSSAVGEDGAAASFAGQFESVLGVADERALRAAFDRCLGSLHGTRAAAYAGSGGERAAQMAIIVQQMVDARVAGVVFTVDPVSMRRDRLAIDVVRGIGEALVGGHAAADHFELTRQGEIVRREPAGTQPAIDDEQLAQVHAGAIAAERAWGAPLDLEWAIDGEGGLCWLQARPITTLAGDLHELDVHHGDDHVYTRYNVGEMIPGAVCPLDLSTTARAVDYAIQRWYVACGARPRQTTELHTIAIRYGHLFFDLTAVLDFAANVAGATRETTMHAICGRPVAELRAPPPASWMVRAINGARYVGTVFAASRRIPRFERAVAQLHLDPRSTAAATYREIDHQLPFLFEAYDVHISASTASGLAGGLIEGILAKGQTPNAEHEAALAELLSGAGVESAAMVHELEQVIEPLAADARARAALSGGTPDEALRWLRGPEAGLGGAAFAAFLRRHGHRAVRELSLQHPGWIDDPLPLVASIQALLVARRAPPRTRPAASDVESALATAARKSPAMRWAVRFAHHAIRQREHTKSLLVQVCHRFKRAYRLLAQRMVAENLCATPDLVFFLTHDELGRLALQGQRALATLAAQRRQVFAAQQRFEFADVSVGPPHPLEPPAAVLDEQSLQGKPVSRGVVEGMARVVHGLAEAAGVQPGEILVAPVIDIGFSPYYHLIGGLATDLGSPMSHGAVVAREYGLPTVSNLRTATRVFRTGDRVELDGDRGVLRCLERAPSATVTLSNEEHPCP